MQYVVHVLICPQAPCLQLLGGASFTNASYAWSHSGLACKQHAYVICKTACLVSSSASYISITSPLPKKYWSNTFTGNDGGLHEQMLAGTPCHREHHHRLRTAAEPSSIIDTTQCPADDTFLAVFCTEFFCVSPKGHEPFKRILNVKAEPHPCIATPVHAPGRHAPTNT